MLDQATIFGLLSLINCITCIFIGSFLYLKNKKSPINFSYFVFDSCIAFYAFFYFLWQSSSNLNWSIPFFKWCIVGVVLINSAFVQFTFVLLNVHEKSKKQLLLIHSINIFYCFAALFLFYVDWKVKFTYGLWPIPSKVFHTYIIWWFLQVIYCFFLIYRKGILLSSGKDKKQYQWIFWATLIAYAGGATNWFVWYGINFPPYLNSGIAIYALVLAYAVFRHQLLGIDVIVKKTIVFTGLVSFVFGIFALTTSFVNEILSHYIPAGRLTASFVSVFVIVLGYDPLRKFLTVATDRFLFQKKSDYAKILREASKNIALVTGLNEVTDATLDILISKARTKSAVIYVRSHIQNDYELRGYQGYEENLPGAILKSNDSIISYLNEHQSPVTKTIIQDELRSAKVKEVQDRLSQILERMNVWQAEVIVPGFLSGVSTNVIENISVNLQCLLVLGGKKSDEDYYEQDLDMLATLAQEHAITFEKARLADENVKEREARVKAEAEARLAAFSKSIAHETKNSLAGLYGPAQFNTTYGYEDFKGIFDRYLQGKLPPPIEKKFLKTLERMKEEGQKVFTKADEIRIVALTAQGTLSSSEDVFEQFDFKVVCDAAKAIAKPGKYQFVRDVPEKIFPYGNVQLIQRVLINLINNAADAMEGQESAEMTLKGGYQEIDGKKIAYFEFSDNGPGIANENLNKIWDQGFSTKPKPKPTDIEASGHGQGLWVCKNTIEEIHKGKIWAESELGKGTTFKFWLPVNDGKIAPSAEGVPMSSSS